jgi:hypothetical protein
MGAASVFVGVGVLAAGARHLRPTEPERGSADEAQLIAVGDLD